MRDDGTEILHSNLSSFVEVQSYKNSEGEDLFLKLFVCSHVLRRNWKATCKQLIVIDGTFLNSNKVKGQFLVELGRDGDNQIYSIEWGNWREREYK